MRYSKLSSKCFLCVFAACLCAPSVSAAQGHQTLSACLESGKKAFAAKSYSQARDAFTRCLKLDPDNVEANLSLAGVLLTQDDLSGAEKYFYAALRNMERTSPYWSYTYSMLGDIALKRQQNDTALKMYTKSLEYNAANVNSLVGKGVIVEYQGDKQGAAEYYRSALAVEPLNLVARKRLISLEPDYLTDGEMLTALKQRYAVEPDAKELTEENRALFKRIHSAEQRGGLDYLKNKYTRVPQDYIVTLNKDTGFARDMLTLDGYNALEKSISTFEIEIDDIVTILRVLPLDLAYDELALHRLRVDIYLIGGVFLDHLLRALLCRLNRAVLEVPRIDGDLQGVTNLDILNERLCIIKWNLPDLVVPVLLVDDLLDGIQLNASVLLARAIGEEAHHDIVIGTELPLVCTGEHIADEGDDLLLVHPAIIDHRSDFLAKIKHFLPPICIPA